MWPFRKNKKPKAPGWWEEYPNGKRLKFLGRDVVVTGVAIDLDIGVYALRAAYADDVGRIHWITLNQNELQAIQVQND